MKTTAFNPVRVIDSSVTEKPLNLVRGTGSSHAVIWPGNGGIYRSFNLIDLDPQDATRDLRHPSEAAYYVAAGSGAVRALDDGTLQALVEGSMIHVGAGEAYRLEAGEAGMRLIGGPVPADPALYDLLAEGSAP